jgi:hypothetical protein
MQNGGFWEGASRLFAADHFMERASGPKQAAGLNRHDHYPLLKIHRK